MSMIFFSIDNLLIAFTYSKKNLLILLIQELFSNHPCPQKSSSRMVFCSCCYLALRPSKVLSRWLTATRLFYYWFKYEKKSILFRKKSCQHGWLFKIHYATGNQDTKLKISKCKEIW